MLPIRRVPEGRRDLLMIPVLKGCRAGKMMLHQSKGLMTECQILYRTVMMILDLNLDLLRHWQRPMWLGLIWK